MLKWSGVMLKLASAFNEIYIEREHSHLLLRNPVTIYIQMEEEFSLRLTPDKLTILRNSLQDYDILLSGSREIISAIFNGEKRLREAQANEELTLQSTFRNALLLESILFLNKPNINFGKFKNYLDD
ncbi:hypothetical protein J2S17_004924 [Cytobacillus purgationiresistens]|uniref:Uncharacterized protein n=2 Tax=Cytobacillus purgationiresistens TaxID=863449 RepID=A0ABU0APS5_9BACI|nr:hypothetical protein [Cytobacillus purgationiresistens]